MNGIEKITQRIDAQAQAEIDQILAQAREDAAQVTARYQAQADRESADLKARGEKAAAEREERMVSVAELEARKTTLAAKQEMVEQAFALALEKLCALPDEQYTKTVAGLLAKAAPDGKGSVIFAKAQRERIGAAAVSEANRLLGEKGKLTLSNETRELRGGFILVNGDVEVNGSFETLVRLQKGTMAGETAKLLFRS
ncbi:MAG: V-type ATP synthase subunit E [Oscillibacter sp.]|jgi:V/A-type H+-transporting ATPase subunit E|nr:V-type ATP synthase subunit E [Oscillibacter sp.]